MAMFVVQSPAISLDRELGLGWNPFDLVSTLTSSPFFTVDNRKCRRRPGCPAKMTASNKEQFQVCMDVQQFTPEEITVKTVGRHVVVEAKHEEKEDEHGFISRQFVRKYLLPEEYRTEDVVSRLSSDGVLSITAPRHKPITQEGERIIPITTTGSIPINVQNNPGSPIEKQAEEKKNED